MTFIYDFLMTFIYDFLMTFIYDFIHDIYILKTSSK